MLGERILKKIIVFVLISCILLLIVACHSDKNVTLITEGNGGKVSTTNNKVNSSSFSNNPSTSATIFPSDTGDTIAVSSTHEAASLIPTSLPTSTTRKFIIGPPEPFNPLGTIAPEQPTSTQNPDDSIIAYTYELNCIINNWVSVGDYVYAVTTSPNELWVFNSATMTSVANIPLPDKPAEIQIEDNTIMISFPNLKSIKFYDKNSYDLISSIDLPNVVSSFVIYNGFVYYTEDDQICFIYRTQITTKETVNVPANNYATFYFPKLLLNKQDNLLYVIESGSDGCRVYYYNLSDLTLNSVTPGNDFNNGYNNGSRNAFFDGEYLYAMSFKLDKKDANNVIGKFVSTATYLDGVLAVNDKIIVTHGRIFDKITLQPIITFDRGFRLGLVTDTGSLLLFSNDKNTLYEIPG